MSAAAFNCNRVFDSETRPVRADLACEIRRTTRKSFRNTNFAAVSPYQIRAFQWRRGESNPRPHSISPYAAKTYNTSAADIRSDIRKPSEPDPLTGAIPDDLRAVVEAWDRLPATIRAGIVAMVRATLTEFERRHGDTVTVATKPESEHRDGQSV